MGLSRHPSSRLGHLAHRQADRRNEGILVVGDDSVSIRAAHQLSEADNMIYIRMGDGDLLDEDPPAPLFLEIDRVTDLLRLELDTLPRIALVATSEDSQNLLLVVHIKQQFDIEDVIVRLNDPQYFDAFADLAVDVVDVATIVAAGLAEPLEQLSESP